MVGSGPVDRVTRSHAASFYAARPTRRTGRCPLEGSWAGVPVSSYAQSVPGAGLPFAVLGPDLSDGRAGGSAGQTASGGRYAPRSGSSGRLNVALHHHASHGGPTAVTLLTGLCRTRPPPPFPSLPLACKSAAGTPERRGAVLAVTPTNGRSVMTTAFHSAPCRYFIAAQRGSPPRVRGMAARAALTARPLRRQHRCAPLTRPAFGRMLTAEPLAGLTRSTSGRQACPPLRGPSPGSRDANPRRVSGEVVVSPRPRADSPVGSPPYRGVRGGVGDEHPPPLHPR